MRDPKTKQNKGRNRSGDRKVSKFKKNTTFYKKRDRKDKAEKTHLKRDFSLPKESFYIFGKNAVEEVLASNPTSISNLMYIEQDKKRIDRFSFSTDLLKENDIDFETVNRDFVKKNIGDVNHQGVIAIVKKYDYLTFEQWKTKLKDQGKEVNNLVVVLDKIEDTHNFGAIIRTAAGAGANAIFVSERQQAPVNGTVFKTSAGNINKIDMVKVKNINESLLKMKKFDFWFYGLGMSENKKQNLFSKEFPKNTAFVLGSEGEGLSDRVSKNCDEIVSIPMEGGVESLNVSVSGAIAMYEWKRQRGE